MAKPNVAAAGSAGVRGESRRLMSKIAVTGSNGLIGSHLCADLAPDHELVRIDLRGGDKAIDIRNLDALCEAVAGCETIVHLARIGGGVEANWEDTQANIAGTYNAFEAARLAGCKRVILASSNHAVGMYEKLGAPEIHEPKNGTLLRTDVPLRPTGLYGVWKCFGEVLGRYYSDEYGLQVACMRIGMSRIEALTNVGHWMDINDEQKQKRVNSVRVTQRDLARLVRAILASDVPFGIVYAVGDNATRFWDLEAGRTLYGFWPIDGIK
jgi:NAD+ dependent glucose-6-phosphate dehydrogenase